MPGNRNHSLQRQFRISEIKYDIQRLEILKEEQDLNTAWDSFQFCSSSVNCND